MWRIINLISSWRLVPLHTAAVSFPLIFARAAQSDEQLYNLSANDKNDTARVYPDI